MLNSLPDDLLWYVSSFLNVSDSLKIDKSFVVYYAPYVIKIQIWFRKYKEKRNLRYSILRNEFEIRNEKIYTAFYANIFFNLYNMKKLKKFLKEYYFLSLLKYFCRNIQNEDILHIYDKTLENMTYSNCKNFLNRLPMELLLRI